MAYPNLTRGEIRKLSKAMRAANMKLPKRGYCVKLAQTTLQGPKRYVNVGDPYANEVCNDGRGYYFVRSTTKIGGMRKKKRGSRSFGACSGTVTCHK